MQLDAPGFTPVLTPEVALGIVQKALAGKNWRKYDVAQIKLVASPYWVFSFDVLAEGGVPTGKAALNAFTGELSEFVPMLLDRPLKKSREVSSDCEVESTSIQQAEVKEAAAAKVAAHAGIKRETVAVSAVSKIYVPFYRIWVDVGEDTYKVDVDACLGAPFGLEAVPAREKQWDEVTAETLKKMQSPKGLAELGAQTIEAVAGVGGKAKPGSGVSSFIGSREGQYVILAVIILAGFWYLFARPQAFAVSCDAAPQFISEKKDFFGSTKALVPRAGNKTSELYVSGACSVTNKGSKPLSLMVRVFILADGRQAASTTLPMRDVPASDVPSVKEFSITWERQAGVKDYSLGNEAVS